MSIVYAVSYSTAGATGPWTVAPGSPVSTPSDMLSGLTASTNYWIQITAQDTVSGANSTPAVFGPYVTQSVQNNGVQANIYFGALVCNGAANNFIIGAAYTLATFNMFSGHATMTSQPAVITASTRATIPPMVVLVGATAQQGEASQNTRRTTPGVSFNDATGAAWSIVATPTTGDSSGTRASRIADMLERFGVITFSTNQTNNLNNPWGASPADYTATSVINAINFLRGSSNIGIQIREFHYAGTESWQQTWCPQVTNGTGGRCWMAIYAGKTDADVASMATLAMNSASGTGWMSYMEGIDAPNGSTPVVDTTVQTAQGDISAGAGQTVGVPGQISSPSLAGVTPSSITLSFLNASETPLATVYPIQPSMVCALPNPDTIAPLAGFFADQLTENDFSPIANVLWEPPYNVDQDDGGGRGGVLNDVVIGYKNVFNSLQVAWTAFHPTQANTQGHALVAAYDAYYTACIFLSAFRANILGWFWYSLFDFGSTAGTGLFPQSGANSPRAAAYTIQAMYALNVESATSVRHTFQTGMLNFSVSGLPAANANAPNSGGQTMLFQNSNDKSFTLFVWNSQNTQGGSAVAVTVTFNGNKPASVKEYRVSDASSSTAPQTALQSLTTPGSITIQLDASVYMLKITPSATNNTVVDQVAYNGTTQLETTEVLQLVYYNHTPYMQATAANSLGVQPGWWYWNYATSAWLAAPGDPATTASVTGTQVTDTVGVILDSSGNTWRLVSSASSGLQIAENGVVNTSTANVVLLLYYNGVMYQENSAGGWWYYNAGWVSTTNPLTGTGSVSPSGTTVLNGSPNVIVDSNSNVWSLSAGSIYQNGTQQTSTANVLLLLYLNGNVFQQATSVNEMCVQPGWWIWNQGAAGWYSYPNDPRE